MKTKHLLLLPVAAILLSFSYLIGSKYAKIVWGPPLTKSIANVLGEDESGIYVERHGQKGFSAFRTDFTTIQAFDTKMNPRLSNEIELKYEGKELNYEFTIFSNGRIFVFGSFYNANLGKSFLFYQEMDKKTLTNKGNLVKVSEVKSKSKYRQGKFRNTVSRDKSKIVLVDESSFKKGETEEFHITVYDVDLNKLWEKSVKLPYSSELFSINQVYVDNDGNFYLSGIVYQEVVKSKRNGKPNYNYSIIAFREQGNATKEYKAQLKDKFITDLSFGVLESEGSIVCGGFFSEKGTFSIKGTFFMSIDAVSESIKKQGIKEFDKDFLEEFMSESKASKGKELFEYDLKELVLKDDGGAVLIAEQYFIEQVTVSSSSSSGQVSTSTTTYYNYNDIIVTNVNPDNTIAWTVKVPKRQSTRGYGYYSSYISMVKGDKVHLVFNDNPSNLNVKDPKRIANFNGKESVITMATITSNGNYEKVLFASNSAEQVIMRPQLSKQVSDNRLILFASLKKTFKLATVSFN